MQKFYYDLCIDLFILNNKTDINISINPINSEAIASKVNGMEKYLMSLNIESDLYHLKSHRVYSINQYPS